MPSFLVSADFSHKSINVWKELVPEKSISIIIK